MKITIISQYFWPENFRINDIAWSLHDKGMEITVVTGKPNYPLGNIFPGYRAIGCQQQIHRGIPIFRIPTFPRGRGGWRLALNYGSFVLSGIFFIPWQLRKTNIDVILVYAPSPILQAIPAILLGWLKGCPVALWVQDLWPESLSATGHIKNRLIIKAVKYVVKWIYRNVDLLLVQSPAFIPKVRALAGNTPIAYHPNSFIEDDVRAMSSHVSCQGFDCEFPILFAGNLGTAQAIHVVLEAATLLKNRGGIRFVMVGDGSKREWMEQQVSARGLNNIVFTGSFPVEVMPTLMSRAAALIVTLADTEIFRLTIPSKVQAYLAAGRPIIACLNGSGAEIVKESGAGITVPAENAPALAQAIMDLYTLPAQERLEMGASGRRYYEEHFRHAKLVGKLTDHLNQAVIHHQGSNS